MFDLLFELDNARCSMCSNKAVSVRWKQSLFFNKLLFYCSHHEYLYKQNRKKIGE